MAFNFEPSTIFDRADSFNAFTEQIRSSRPVAALDGSGQKCELQRYDCVYNSRGDQVLLQSGTRYNLDRDAGKSYKAALVETKFWKREGESSYSELEIRSPHMKAALKAVVPEYRDYNIDVRHITLRNEPCCLFHYRDELFLYGYDLQDTEGQMHVSFLLQHTQQILSSSIYAYYASVDYAVVTLAPPSLDFANLWMVFKPGDIVIVSEKATTKSWISFEFKSMDLSCRCDLSICEKTHNWKVSGRSLDFNGSDGAAEMLMKDGGVVDKYGDDDRSPLQSKLVW